MQLCPCHANRNGEAASSRPHRDARGRAREHSPGIAVDDIQTSKRKGPKTGGQIHASHRDPQAAVRLISGAEVQSGKMGSRS